MNQDRLNHLIVLRIHKLITDDLNSKVIANNLISDSELQHCPIATHRLIAIVVKC